MAVYILFLLDAIRAHLRQKADAQTDACVHACVQKAYIESLTSVA